MLGLKELAAKYSVSGPRYTSYPTAPQWSEAHDDTGFFKSLSRVETQEPAALYVHIPFCESLCLYCGCNIHLTREREKGEGYVEAVLSEVQKVASALPGRLRVSQVAWGGGTPTFLSERSLERLYRGTCEWFDIESDAEISVEIDPRVTSHSQLKLLRGLGFNRVSLGVQDFDPAVQGAVHRIQSPESTYAMRAWCRELGFSGVNYDLIYGLPLQTVSSFVQTIDCVVAHQPDRIALYNYAHLPALLRHQRALERHAFLGPQERAQLFEQAYSQLTLAGYASIGMDHFARESDDLCAAYRTFRLYRNFQGYTVKRGMPLLGFGASAISELAGAYYQNVRSVSSYQDRIAQGRLATLRGCELTPDDSRRKWVIQRWMCRFGVVFAEYESAFNRLFGEDYDLSSLDSLIADGLVIVTPHGIEATDNGRLFIRNIAMAFDAYLGDSNATYSKTV